MDEWMPVALHIKRVRFFPYPPQRILAPLRIHDLKQSKFRQRDA